MSVSGDGPVESLQFAQQPNLLLRVLAGITQGFQLAPAQAAVHPTQVLAWAHEPPAQPELRLAGGDDPAVCLATTADQRQLDGQRRLARTGAPRSRRLPEERSKGLVRGHRVAALG